MVRCTPEQHERWRWEAEQTGLSLVEYIRRVVDAAAEESPGVEEFREPRGPEQVSSPRQETGGMCERCTRIGMPTCPECRRKFR